MTSKCKRVAGLSLVELLLAVAIIGVIFLALATLTRSTLGYSARVDALNDSLVELNDAVGYIALNARRSARLLDESDNLRIYHEPTGGEFICSPTEPDPCIGMIVPIVDPDTAKIDGYELLAYRVVPISAWSENPGIPQGWDRENTKILLQYETYLCNCTSAPTVETGTISADYVSLVLPDLYLQDADGNYKSPFTLVGADQLRISFRVKTPEGDSVIPSTAPAEIVVSRRQ